MKLVDHEARRHEILLKSLKLFSDMGYEAVTLQHIAAVCGISRTTLYQYFTDKKDVFDNALYHLVQVMGREVNDAISANTALNPAEKLNLVMKKSVEICQANAALLRTIFEYLIALRRQGISVEHKIRRHTVGFRCAIKNIIQEGIAKGVFRPVSPMLFQDFLFGLNQTLVMQLMFYDKTDFENLKKQMDYLIASIKTEHAE